jgi:SNF2 family DNA or RNA helicase
MIRNRRFDGQVYLPDRSVKIVPLEFSPDEKLLYDGVQQFLKEAYQDVTKHHKSVLPLLTLQREVCSSPYAAMISLNKMAERIHTSDRQAKIFTLLEIAQQIKYHTKTEKVLELISTMNDKCIVFTEYRATQDFLMSRLQQNGIKAVPFRGGFKRSKKDWMTDLFKHNVQVLVATESGGEGINLQFCHYMINFDLPWNPMRLEQRIGRIHRLGQQSIVQIYNLSTRNTIEEHIVALLVEKIRMFEAVIGEVDHILGDPQIQKKIETDILDIALTTESQEELKNRMSDYASTMWSRYQSGRQNS